MQIGELRTRIDLQGELSWSDRETVAEFLRTAANAWPTLELASARHVVPIWTSRYPTTRLLDLLDLAGRVLRGSDEADVLRRAADAFDALVVELALEADSSGAPLAPTWAGDSAVAAAWSVLGEPRSRAPELETDPEEWSAAFYAAAAYSGAAPWTRSEGSPHLRREYWEWWLEEAHSIASSGLPRTPAPERGAS